MYAKGLSEPKYQFLIEKCENVGIKNLKDPSPFIEYPNTMNDFYNNSDYDNPKSKKKKLIVFHDMIADIITNKKFQAIIKELFIRWGKLNISLVFITDSYISVPKDARLNYTYYLIMKVYNKRELLNLPYKNDINEQVKILNGKIKANKVQNDFLHYQVVN